MAFGMIRKKRKRKKAQEAARLAAAGGYPISTAQQQAQITSGNLLLQNDPTMKFGWIGPTFTRMANSRRWAWSLNPANQIIIAGTAILSQPLMMVHNSPADVLNAARLAVQGDSVKIIAQALWPVVPADTSLTLTGSKVFGVRVRVSNSVLNFKYAAVNIRLLDAATLRGEIWVQVNQLPLDVIIFAVTSANGLASIVPITSPVITFLLANNAGLVSGDALYAESLNMRDIGDIPNAGAQCAIT
jgi:hypothetical protein